MHYSQDKSVPVTTAWHVLRLQMNGLQYGGWLGIYSISSRGQTNKA